MGNHPHGRPALGLLACMLAWALVLCAPSIARYAAEVATFYAQHGPRVALLALAEGMR